jgi:ribosome maturation factor RimP
VTLSGLSSLKRPADFVRYLNSPVLLKLYRAQDGRKEFAGHLAAYDEATGDITITVGKESLTFTKKDVALVRLRVEF